MGVENLAELELNGRVAGRKIRTTLESPQVMVTRFQPGVNDRVDEQRRGERIEKDR